MKRLTILILFAAMLALTTAGTACAAAEQGELTTPPQPVEQPDGAEPQEDK